MLLTFGKYKNKSIDDVFKMDKHYRMVKQTRLV